MDIRTAGVAGTLESSDVMVTVEPGSGGVEIEINSTVKKRFGREIRRVVGETLKSLGVESARVRLVDKGALECTLRARVKAAVHRARGVDYYEWEVFLQ